MEQIDTCPSCGRDTTADSRFPGSAWCKSCVETTLERQAAEAADRKVKREVIHV